MQIYCTLLMPFSDQIIISRAQVEKLQLELLKEMYFFSKICGKNVKIFTKFRPSGFVIRDLQQCLVNNLFSIFSPDLSQPFVPQQLIAVSV